MRIGVLKETFPGENRVAMIPSAASKLIKRNFEIIAEKNIGQSIRLNDADYEKESVKMASRDKILSTADIILRVRKPDNNDISKMKSGALQISFLDPFNEKPLIDSLAKHHISAVSVEMIPRSTIAQKMDALSSQANLAGYVTVIVAAERLNKILPMMMTPAGTIAPARVFVIGAGVAGLQAIATAKRLGARVEAFDTRPVVKEQVQSLGAKFIEIDLGETGQTKDGYAKALTDEQLQKQRDGMAKICAQSDIVITTAQLFGRKAPRIVTSEMIQGMRPGSVIVDMAVETGGNVEGSKLNEEIDINGVTIIGLSNLPGHVAEAASQMYASNLVNFIEHFTDRKTNEFKINRDDEIIQSALITDNGAIVNEQIKNFYNNK